MYTYCYFVPNIQVVMVHMGIDKEEEEVEGEELVIIGINHMVSTYY